MYVNWIYKWLPIKKNTHKPKEFIVCVFHHCSKRKAFAVHAIEQIIIEKIKKKNKKKIGKAKQKQKKITQPKAIGVK